VHRLVCRCTPTGEEVNLRGPIAAAAAAIAAERAAITTAAGSAVFRLDKQVCYLHYYFPMSIENYTLMRFFRCGEVVQRVELLIDKHSGCFKA